MNFSLGQLMITVAIYVCSLTIRWSLIECTDKIVAATLATANKESHPDEQ